MKKYTLLFVLLWKSSDFGMGNKCQSAMIFFSQPGFVSKHKFKLFQDLIHNFSRMCKDLTLETINDFKN